MVSPQRILSLFWMYFYHFVLCLICLHFFIKAISQQPVYSAISPITKMQSFGKQGVKNVVTLLTFTPHETQRNFCASHLCNLELSGFEIPSAKRKDASVGEYNHGFIIMCPMPCSRCWGYSGEQNKALGEMTFLIGEEGIQINK